MTNAEKREAARQLIQKWHNKGREDEDDRSYWQIIIVAFGLFVRSEFGSTGLRDLLVQRNAF